MNKFISKTAIITFGLLTILTFNQTISAHFCDTKPPQNGNEKVWTLIRVNGEKINTGKATLALDFKKKRVGGSGGCNSFGGDLEKKGSKIKISRIISTKMFCKDGSDAENKYLTTLEKANKMKIAGGKLQLFSGETIVLEFVAET